VDEAVYAYERLHLKMLMLKIVALAKNGVK
jgi:hypothetical protein